MATNGSATTRTETPHANGTTRTNTILNALKQRAQAVLNDETIDPESRAIVRKALHIYDPWLAEMVRRADAGEPIIATTDSYETTEATAADASRDRIEALAEIICRGGDDSAAALLVLMGMLQDSTQPKVLANTAKHFAFTRCGELNVNGMVEAQIAVLESELFASNTIRC